MRPKSTLEVKQGDVYLMCSDAPDRLAASLTLEPEAACRDLVRAAFEAGNHDNITGVVVRCV